MEDQECSTVPVSECETIKKKVCNTVTEDKCRTVMERSTERKCRNVPETSCVTVNKTSCSLVNKRKDSFHLFNINVRKDVEDAQGNALNLYLNSKSLFWNELVKTSLSVRKNLKRSVLISRRKSVQLLRREFVRKEWKNLARLSKRNNVLQNIRENFKVLFKVFAILS